MYATFTTYWPTMLSMHERRSCSQCHPPLRLSARTKPAVDSSHTTILKWSTRHGVTSWLCDELTGSLFTQVFSPGSGSSI